MKQPFSYPAGFTIIEVMLFLAVSGALAVGILGASTVGINTQRYRDALNSLQSTLQQQYNQVSHVVNTRDGSEACSSSGVEVEPATREPRGTSQCLVMGRYVSLETSGAMRSSNIIGVRNSTPLATNDIEELAQYSFSLDSSSTESSSVPWGAQVSFKDADNEDIATEAMAMMILRSPLTGVARTFITPSQPGVIPDGFITAETAQEVHKLCIESASFALGSRLGILIRERAASSNAIELLTEDSGC